MNTKRADFKQVLREYIESLLVAVILALVLRTFVFSAYKIPSESMLPTLRIGDFIFAYKLPFGIDVPFTEKKWVTGRLPNRGDLVVFKHPKDKSASFVKRVVGLPGDRVEIRNGKLWINEVEASTQVVTDASIPGWNASDQHDFIVEKFSEKPHVILVPKGVSPESFGPIFVPPNEIFVLGDHRSTSDDSRYWGTVPVENIEGRVFLIWLSLDWRHSDSRLPSIRWERLFKTF